MLSSFKGYLTSTITVTVPLELVNERKLFRGAQRIAAIEEGCSYLFEGAKKDFYSNINFEEILDVSFEQKKNRFIVGFEVLLSAPMLSVVDEHFLEEDDATADLKGISHGLTFISATDLEIHEKTYNFEEIEKIK